PMSRAPRGSAAPMGRGSSPPGSSEEPRDMRATLPPNYHSSPPATSPQSLAAMHDASLPFTPRSMPPLVAPNRRAEQSQSSPALELRDEPRDSGAGVAPTELPEALGLGDAPQAFAICVRERATGALVIDAPEGVRRILLRDGDVVTAASGLDDESLVAFLGARGDLPRDVAAQLNGKVPAYGRHAGAALVANGHISQDQLWPVLRAHAEWILSCAVCAEKGVAGFEVAPPGRLKAEPSVFGGATGSEVLIEVVRRAVPAEAALLRIGGASARIEEGPRWSLISECALPAPEQEWLDRSKGTSLGEALGSERRHDIIPMIYALSLLDVLSIGPGVDKPRAKRPSPSGFDPIDVQAVRSQVKTRLNLVEEGDYFSLLGVPRSATAYEIHRAYLELRRGLEPSRVLNAATADLADDLQLIIEVLDEAHEILRDHSRRERYRRAIEDKPPL
ncbi:MAG TPA: DUF4388 domain-containing protein, partial [Polyangiaceae bacterium]|nr:DUF4388 domain-containing protein [Polyangiaceae bacterium]